MLDFQTIQNNTENPTFLTILMTVLLSFALSSLIVFTYDKTSKEPGRPIHFLQALVLISIVAATVMQAIGDSLARGLGMLGALAIIRFRTTLTDPRNMTFMFASLAAGIACGVYGFVIAITGTVAFCFVAFVIWFSPFGEAPSLLGILRFETPIDREGDPVFGQTLKGFCKKVSLKQYKSVMRTLVEADPESGQLPIQVERLEFTYNLYLKEGLTGGDLKQTLEEMEGVEAVRIRFEPSSKQV